MLEVLGNHFWAKFFSYICEPQRPEKSHFSHLLTENGLIMQLGSLSRAMVLLCGVHCNETYMYIEIHNCDHPSHCTKEKGNLGVDPPTYSYCQFTVFSNLIEIEVFSQN